MYYQSIATIVVFADSFFKDNPSMSMINDSEDELYKYVTINGSEIPQIV